MEIDRDLPQIVPTKIEQDLADCLALADMKRPAKIFDEIAHKSLHQDLITSGTYRFFQKQILKQ